MLILSHIPKCASDVVINPLKKTQAILGKLATSSLESSPVTDVFVKRKPELAILGEIPTKTVKEIVSQDTQAMGKDAMVFPIPNYPHLVLRAEKTAVENIDQLSESARLIPIKHTEQALSHDNLGLPIYSLIDKTSPLYEKESITPIEALGQKDNIMVLKRVTGIHPMGRTYKALKEVYGMENGFANMFQQINLENIMAIRKQYGIEGVRKCVELFKKGGDVTIPEGFLGPNSEQFDFYTTERFLKNQKEFTRTYIEELKEISEMPIEAYKKAVDTILMDKNFLIDFQHTNNTFVDLKNNQFNFMDFEYDKNNTKYIYGNPVKEFREVLLGKNFSKKVSSPMALIIDRADILQCKEYGKIITEKLYSVTPEEYIPKKA